MATVTTTSTPSTTTYRIELDALEPMGMLTEEDLSVISDLLSFNENGTGFFTRGGYLINFEASMYVLTVGYAKRGRHALV